MEPVWDSFSYFFYFLSLKHAFDFVPIYIYFLQDHVCTFLYLVLVWQRVPRNRLSYILVRDPSTGQMPLQRNVPGCQAFLHHKSGELSAISLERDALDQMIEEDISAGA